MNKSFTVVIGIIFFFFSSCTESKEDKAFRIFNEGVSFSLDAGTMMEEGDLGKGNDYRKFGIRVLMSALEYSDNDEKIVEIINGYAIEMNDDILLKWIKERGFEK